MYCIWCYSYLMRGTQFFIFQKAGFTTGMCVIVLMGLLTLYCCYRVVKSRTLICKWESIVAWTNQPSYWGRTPVYILRVCQLSPFPFYLCVCTCATVHTWRSKVSLKVSVFFFYVSRLGLNSDCQGWQRLLNLLSLLAGPSHPLLHKALLF